ncbi:MAG: imidazoleglycerol-phosphate dehydratase HisB [Betaproteobacteria bacterium]|nr:imidazoleglycerol-phosphate dehydratase HisB [Betaproteobacteria bacterium]
MSEQRRQAEITRRTAETAIDCQLSLAGEPGKIATGIPFFDHMLDQIARHGRFGLSLSCNGDLQVDQHHTVEDCGIVLGEAIAAALGDKAGIVRFASAYAPLDEALARSVIDLSGRAGLFFRATFSRQSAGDFELQLVREFFQGFANAAQATVHIDLLEGNNAHHQVEAIFKSFALALADAVAVRDPGGAVPSTKGSL